MTIRRATISDAAAIAAVHVRSWQGAYRGVLPQDFLDDLDVARRVRVWERILGEADWPRAGTLVAHADDGELIGFVDFRATRDQDRDPVTTGEIISIYVLPGVFGGGVGRRLMAAAVDALATAGFARANLWVLADNARARRFYEAAGWTRDGTTKRDEVAGVEVTEVRYERPLP